MSRHKHEEQELPFVALMDTMTNVVGVLIIVMVMVGISLAAAVNKILSDLPPVTKEQHQEMVEKMKKLPLIPADPAELDSNRKLVELELEKAANDLKKIDTTAIPKDIVLDLEKFRKQLDEAKAKRAKDKAELDKLLAEIERMNGLIANAKRENPDVVAPPPKYVRLPNPRAYPKTPKETRVLVAQQGVLTFNEADYVKPILDGLDKVKKQLEYQPQDVKIDPFRDMLVKIFNGPQGAQQVWPEIAPFAGHFQMDDVAIAFKTLGAAGLQPNKSIMSSLGDVSVVYRTKLATLAEAIVALTKGDLTKYTAMDTSKDPTKPAFKATAAPGKITFKYGTGKDVDVKANPKDILAYFVKDLAGMDAFKNKGRDKTIYDAFKIHAMLERAASSPTVSGSFTIVPTIKPGSNLVQLVLKPKAGETLAQMAVENSNYQRLLRQIKGDPNGVAVFQVMSDAFDAYLEARKIADNIGVPARWDFIPNLDITINVAGYEVQRFAEQAPPPKRDPNAPDPVNIKRPGINLD